jgi:hypothetical protein
VDTSRSLLDASCPFDADDDDLDAESFAENLENRGPVVKLEGWE